MKIDVRVGQERNQFAEQIKHIPQSTKDLINRMFCDDETDDFYEGLLAAFASAYVILQENPNELGQQIIGAIVVMLSDKTIREAAQK